MTRKSLRSIRSGFKEFPENALAIDSARQAITIGLSCGALRRSHVFEGVSP
jgi:hypothetical protein